MINSIVNVKRLSMPEDMNGAVTFNTATGKYTIYINRNLTGPQFLRTLRHEELHILLGHFERNDLNADQFEQEAHNIINEIYGEEEQ